MTTGHKRAGRQLCKNRYFWLMSYISVTDVCVVRTLNVYIEK